MESLQWCRMSVIDHPITGHCSQRFTSCLFSSLRWLIPKKNHTSALLALCGGNPPLTGGFPSQRTNNAENVSIPWLHHDYPDSKVHGANIWRLPGSCRPQLGPMSLVIRVLQSSLLLALDTRIWASPRSLEVAIPIQHRRHKCLMCSVFA